MGGHGFLAQLHHKIGAVIALVGGQRDRLRPIGMRFDQRQCRQPLGVARSARGHRTDDQAVAVLHQGVAQETQPRLLARFFATETGIGVGGRDMGVVASAFTMEVTRAIATGSWRLVRAVFGAETLRARPGFNVPSTEK
jgi:hypothetical protein